MKIVVSQKLLNICVWVSCAIFEICFTDLATAIFYTDHTYCKFLQR